MGFIWFTVKTTPLRYQLSFWWIAGKTSHIGIVVTQNNVQFRSTTISHIWNQNAQLLDSFMRVIVE